MAHVTNARAEEATHRPQTFRGHPVSCGEYVVIYDDTDAADQMAHELGTYAKHSDPRHEASSWEKFSIVKLPEGWFSEP